eukprot:gene15773-20890_t
MFTSTNYGGGFIVSKKAVEALGDKFGTAPVCAGPYAFESRLPQDRISLKRYPGHWNAKEFHFDAVTYMPIPNSPVRVANPQAGTLDLVEFIPPSDMPAVQKDPKLKLMQGDALGYTGININVNNGPAAQTVLGQNPLVRLGGDAGIDAQRLVNQARIGAAA